MNPLLDIIQTDEQNNLKHPRLITIGAQAGHGKSLVVNTMVMNYIKSCVNVILFSETQERTSKILFNYIDSLKLIGQKKLGNLIIENLFFEDTIEAFNKLVAHYMKFLNGSCIIVIDGDMFGTQQHSFSYTKFKNENTRFVIFEKFNINKELIYLKEKIQDKYTRNQVISETLRTLAVRFNTHVIISVQQNKTIATGRGDILSTSLAYVSDLYLFSQKHTEQNEFSIHTLKYRDGNSGVFRNYTLEPETLTLKINRRQDFNNKN